MRVNIAALRSRDAEGVALKRYGRVAAILSRCKGAEPESGADWVDGLCRRLNIPGLAGYGIRDTHMPDLVDKAARASSTKGNPIVLSAAEMHSILNSAL
jgi:alcohol dehydrogenase class IV